MTPARYDLLSLIDEGGSALQASLNRALGVHRQTTFVMLKRLRELGWLQRTWIRESRTFRVTLTELGRALLKLARTIVEDPKNGFRLLFGRFFRDAGLTIYFLFETLRMLSRLFGNRSTYHSELPIEKPPLSVVSVA